MSGSAPLLYPTHFASGAMESPRQSKKPNAIINNAETKKWLYPKGSYTVVRRFSSKEERRRIVANVVDPGAFKGDAIGFENHLNVFHSGKKGIDRDVAHGLSVFRLPKRRLTTTSAASAATHKSTRPTFGYSATRSWRNWKSSASGFRRNAASHRS